MKKQSSQSNTDAKDLEKFGYVQELLREMGGFSNFAISFSIISILTGAIQLYGYGLNHGGPLQMTAGWWLVSFFTMLVALSMAELASAYPTSGALYHWSSFLGGRALGWFTACFNTVGQFAILAGIDYGLTLLLIGAMGWESSTFNNVTIYAVLLFSHAIFNHIGIRLVAWLNAFSAWYHIAVVVILVGSLFSVGLAQPVEFLKTPYTPPETNFSYTFLIGLLLAQWTLTGYDASAHLTEETLDPRRTAPWGIFLAVTISVIVGFIMIGTITLSIPDLNQALALGDNAFSEILKLRLGEKLGKTIVLLVLGAMWLCGLSAMTSASRMIYAFSRDGGLPFSHKLATINPKHKTPVTAIWTLAIFALGLAISVKVYSAVVSIATIALYISYGLPLAARLFYRMKGKPDIHGPWHLGKFSTIVAAIALLWICFISVIFILPPNEQAGKVMGWSLGILLVAWFLRVRKTFRGPPISHLGKS